MVNVPESDVNVVPDSTDQTLDTWGDSDSDDEYESLEEGVTVGTIEMVDGDGNIITIGRLIPKPETKDRDTTI